MKTHRIILVLVLSVIGILLSGCSQRNADNGTNLLSTRDFVSIMLSAPQGSGAIRTLTLHYRRNGEDQYDTLDYIRRIDCEGYDDEKREQTLTSSDSDRDGIVDVIVYREFWFPDIEMAHAGIPEWPTVYEYDVEDGFVVASSKHKNYFDTYIKSSKDQLSTGVAHMDDTAILALKRLVVAAERIAEGSFKPRSPYDALYYDDVYHLTKYLRD